MAENDKIQKTGTEETGLAEFGEFDPAALDDEDKFVNNAEASDWLNKPEGDTIFRFLPPPIGEALPWIVVYEHSIKLPGMEFATRFPCPKLMARKPCSYCAKSDQLKATKNEADGKLSFSLVAKRQCYADVIDRANEEHGPFIYGFGKKTHEPLKLLLRRLTQKGRPAFFHPVHGRDIVLHREGLGQFDTTYTVSLDDDASPLHADPEVVKRWDAMRHDFSAFVVPRDDAENQRTVEEAADRQTRDGGGRGGGGGGGGSRSGGGRGRTAQSAIEDDDAFG